MIGTQILHYRIEKKLGEGRMGEVFLATDTKLTRKVALKFLPRRSAEDPKLEVRFEHEARAAAALRHTNIVTIHELAEHDGREFIVMEWVDGPTLSAYCREQDPGVDEILDLAMQIARGLQQAHEADVVHRDLKPANILVDRKRQPRIVDFGLARLKGATSVTESGTTLGTAAYMSPEQSQGQKADERADIWSLGVILYEMLARRRPFDAEHKEALLYLIAHEDPEPLERYKSGISKDLQTVVSRCLAKNREERYQSAADLAADLLRIKHQGKPHPVPVRSWWQRWKRRLTVAGALIIAAAVVILIWDPFGICGPGLKVPVSENRLAVMYFHNVTDPQDSLRIGEIVTNLVITDLMDSKGIDVVPSQRLYDILKLLKREGQKHIDRAVATEVAKRSRSRWMVLGSIVQIEPNIVLTSQLTEVESGNSIGSQKITGLVGESVFDVVDRLTAELMKDLPLRDVPEDLVDRPVAELTTHSPEAYRHYLEGLDDWEKGQFPAAAASFDSALEADSNMAMANFWLGRYMRRDEARDRIQERIPSLLDQVTERERYYLEFLISYWKRDYDSAIIHLTELAERYPQDKYAPFFLGEIYLWTFKQFDSAASYLDRALDLDSLHRMSYNLLSVAHFQAGDQVSALLVINKLIERFPDEANGYDTRGALYLASGDLEKAVESYEKALELAPDNAGSMAKLGDICIELRQYDKAEAQFVRLTSLPGAGDRARGRLHHAKIFLHQGRFREALDLLEAGIEADGMEVEHGNTTTLEKIWRRALIYYRYLDDFEAALVEAERLRVAAREFPRPARWLGAVRGLNAVVLARRGQYRQADTALTQCWAAIDTNSVVQVTVYRDSHGQVEFIKGNYDAAIEQFEQSAKSEWRHTHLGRSHLAAGRPGEAVSHFTQALDYYEVDRGIPWPELKVVLHYDLGRAYEASGWQRKAIEQYQTFLDIWKNADPGLELVEDARARLARLTAVP